MTFCKKFKLATITIITTLLLLVIKDFRLYSKAEPKIDNQQSNKSETPRPGSQVEWLDFPKINELRNESWGNFLTDIKNHLPESMIRHYQFPDKNTDCHETTHAIHSHLNNTENKMGKYVYYCLYPGNNKAFKVKQPKITIEDIADAVPQSLRKSRYDLYLVKQRSGWNKYPLYLWDEWMAYCNGADCGIELINKGIYKPGTTDAGWSVLEFNVYATYVAMVQKQKDPSYDSKQLLETLAWNLERGMNLYKEGQKLKEYDWDKDEYLKYLQTSEDAANFRKFLTETYGKEWVKKVFGF